MTDQSQASTGPFRVVVADELALVRAGLRAMLAGVEGSVVVGEAVDGPAALKLVLDLRPDALIADMNLPGLSGLSLLRECRQAQLSVNVVLLATYEQEESILEAIRLGVAGYLMKRSALQDLRSAFAAIRRGETYFSYPVVTRLMQVHQGARGSLTERQRDVLRLIAKGLSSKEAAQVLGLSTKTVESHRSQIMDRLDIRDLAGLVRYAVRAGLLTPDE